MADDVPDAADGNIVSGFLDDMASSSAARVAQALRHESADALERRARQAAPSPPLRLSPQGFDVIAELKLRSPAAGRLGDAGQDWLGRVAAYARGGAAAVSVLTEPSRFDGSLDHLRQAAAVLAPLGVPAMRKDFLVDPYQVLEARAAGAGGVLVILRMLARPRISQLLEVAAEHRMFVLLEAFDADDLELALELMTARAASRGIAREPILIGVNSRDLQTLDVVQERFAALAPLLPAGWPAVAESGVAGGADALRMQKLGYRLALIGTALMARGDPAPLLREIFHATRTAQP
jgi:indole-3-glycerol phosphate synthase